jgi:hypothetical protein
MFGKIKHFKSIATRYNKTAISFFGFCSARGNSSDEWMKAQLLFSGNRKRSRNSVCPRKIRNVARIFVSAED